MSACAYCGETHPPTPPFRVRPPLTVGDLTTLSMIAEAVEQGRRIALLQGESVLTGVARAFTHDGGGFLGPQDDVRDGFVWVSGMFEHWWPVDELMVALRAGELSLDYTP